MVGFVARVLLDRGLRIAFGPQGGSQKSSLCKPCHHREEDSNNPKLAKANGFSLHAGVAAQAHQRRKLERLCRYISPTGRLGGGCSMVPSVRFVYLFAGRANFLNVRCWENIADGLFISTGSSVS